MLTAKRNHHHFRATPLAATHTVAGSPRRGDAESFIRGVFSRHYGASVPSFAPNLLLLERDERIVAAAGWRPARDDSLFLECYLDEPIEGAVSRLAGHPVPRASIVEVGNLAAERPGGSLDVIATLSDHLHGLGYEWVVFTATRELIGIFARIGLPLPVVARADPVRLGTTAAAWGSYYDRDPIVVAGRIRLAFERRRP